jgi:1,4-alpha-glucan branching enzyme
VHQLGENKYIIAEDLAGYDHINFVAGFQSQWDAQFFYTVYHTIKTPSDSDRHLSKLADTLLMRYTGTPLSRIIYTEHHDTIPSKRESRIPVATSSNCLKNEKEQFYAFRRTMQATVLLLTTPGIPMLLQGQEFFETSCPNWPDPPTVNWDNQILFGHILKIYENLIRLRTNHTGVSLGLTGPGIRIYHTNEMAKVMAVHRYERGGPGDDVIIVYNFSNKKFPIYKIGIPRPGKWQVRYKISSILSDPAFGDKIDPPDFTTLESETSPYDGYFFALSLQLSNYDALILSQDNIKKF